jgi:hypothetical protein
VIPVSIDFRPSRTSAGWNEVAVTVAIHNRGSKYVGLAGMCAGLGDTASFYADPKDYDAQVVGCVAGDTWPAIPPGIMFCGYTSAMVVRGLVPATLTPTRLTLSGIQALPEGDEIPVVVQLGGKTEFDPASCLNLNARVPMPIPLQFLKDSLSFAFTSVGPSPEDKSGFYKFSAGAALEVRGTVTNSDRTQKVPIRYPFGLLGLNESGYWVHADRTAGPNCTVGAPSAPPAGSVPVVLCFRLTKQPAIVALLFTTADASKLYSLP